MAQLLLENRFSLTAVVLFVIGLSYVFLHPNLIIKVVGFNIMDSAIFLLLTSRGYIQGRVAAILVDGGADVSRYVNPIPAGLVLTGIVVSVSLSAFSLALIQRIHRRYGTIDMRQLLLLVKKDEEV